MLGGQKKTGWDTPRAADILACDGRLQGLWSRQGRLSDPDPASEPEETGPGPDLEQWTGAGARLEMLGKKSPPPLSPGARPAHVLGRAAGRGDDVELAMEALFEMTLLWYWQLGRQHVCWNMT